MSAALLKPGTLSYSSRAHFQMIFSRINVSDPTFIYKRALTGDASLTLRAGFGHCEGVKWHLSQICQCAASQLSPASPSPPPTPYPPPPPLQTADAKAPLLFSPTSCSYWLIIGPSCNLRSSDPRCSADQHTHSPQPRPHTLACRLTDTKERVRRADKEHGG